MSHIPYDRLEEAMDSGGVPALFDALERLLEEDRRYAQLFDALLMRKRHEVGVPLQGGESLRHLPEKTQIEVENYYIECCRRVGGLFLRDGDIPGAWPFFRAIDEPEQIAAAIEAFDPEAPASPGGRHPDAEAVVDIALAQGANARRGFELLLARHDLGRAVSAMDHQVPARGDVHEACGRRLIGRIYRDVLQGLEGEGAATDREAPSGLGDLLGSRPDLGREGDPPVDPRHLRAAIRTAATLHDRGSLERAVELADYGRRLPRKEYSPEPAPFEDFYADARIYLLALLGTGVDGAVRFFRKKARDAFPDGEGKHVPGEVLVSLLARVGRPTEAIEAHIEYLADRREPAPSVPTLLELSEQAGDFAAHLARTREKDEPLEFAIGLVTRAQRTQR